MAKKRILICDRCGFELTGKNDVELALDGAESWQTAQRGRGEEPRGVFPCKNFIRCHGEMQLIER
ncbi:MAG: hypothetical protein HYX85_00705 [Chloroflexi bacterium]|nr:hypothetical protein [Chloroflexota bacterium]